MAGEFYAKREALRKAFQKFYKDNREQLDAIYDALAAKAKELGLHKKFKEILRSETDNPLEALRKAAEELGLADAYREVFESLERSLRRELALAYKNTWKSKDRMLMEEIAAKKKLSEAYTYAMMGEYAKALETAGAKVTGEKVKIGDKEFDMPKSYAGCLKLIAIATNLKEAYKDLWKFQGK